MTPRRTLWLVQRISREAWMALAAVGLLVVAWVAVASYGASSYAAGRASVTDAAKVVTPSVTVTRAADSIAKAKTDTIVQRIVVTRWKVDTLIRLVPDSLRAIPAIAALTVAATTLTAQVDTLTHTLTVERVTSRLNASVDSSALASAKVITIQQEDQIMSLKRRPQWRTVFAVGALGVVAGVLR
jgi:PBP1b-binding outer membrane lipoprotein LpoB